MRRSLVLLLLLLLAAFPLHSLCSTEVTHVDEGSSWDVSPIIVQASATSNCVVTAMQVYIDGELQFVQYNQPTLLAYIPVSPGNHYVAFKAWTNDGSSALNGPFLFKVTSERPAACVPAFGPTVLICMPENLTETKQAIAILAAAKSDADPVAKMRVMIDDRLGAEFFDRTASMAFYAQPMQVGVHRITAQAITQGNQSYQNQVNVNITSLSHLCETPTLSMVSPIPGDSSQLPVFLAAADSAACPISAFRVYVDDRAQYTQYLQGVLTGRLNIPQGQHRVVLQAWNNLGALNKKAFNINVVEAPENLCDPNSDPGIAICSAEPIGSGYVAIFFGTTVNPSVPITAIRLYVDDISRALIERDAVARGISTLRMTAGHHHIVAVAWTKDGTVVSSSTTVDVPPFVSP